MRYLLGIDGGNSKTLAAVADEYGCILGLGRAGGSNYQGFGVQHAMSRLRLAAQCAFEMVDIAPANVDAASYCLAGADLAEDFELLEPAVRDLALAGRYELNNDSLAILRAGSDCADAIAVCWGSGANAVGRNAAGATLRLPALGWISGDWGGGDDLAREAIRLVARAHDGRGEPTMLEDLILQTLDVSTVDEMIRTLHLRRHRTADRAREEPEILASLSPMIFQAARSGDPVARNLVKRAGAEVATMATALLRRLDLLDRPADVVLGGGVFKSRSPLLLETVRDRLAATAPNAIIVLPDLEPVVGAVFRAMDSLHVPVDKRVRESAQWSYEQVTSTVRLTQ